ncbi:MAG: hypothetical protein KIG36_00355 [Eubacteriales bacterium]|nr:hypothetical protein [Eubacteriales bacterium]
MRTRRLLLIFVILGCVLGLLTGCGSPTPTPTPAPTPAPTPTGEPTPAAPADLAKAGTPSAFRSDEGHGPEKAIDGDDATCWSSASGLGWLLSFDETVTFNTIRIRFDGEATAWAVQYRGPATDGKYIDVPGAVKNYRTETSLDETFRVNPVEATDVQVCVYQGSGMIRLYSFELYDNPGQIAVDAMNSYITVRRNRVLGLVNRGGSVFDLFPASQVEATNVANWTTEIERDNGKLFFNNSKWARGLDETTVFDAQITHKQLDDPSLDWTMRVGLGGQVYSFEAGGLGELVPLQCSGSEWVDEVWQIVAVSAARMMDRTFAPATHFIHQAGMYKIHDHGDEFGQNYMDDTFYSPRLADRWDERTRTFSMLNLGVTPTYNLTRSDTVYYTEITDKGDGAIEFLYGVANYSDNSIDFMNLPWGGVSHKRLPDIVMSRPDNSYYLWGEGGNTDTLTCAFSETAGWMGYTQNINDPDGFTVAFVLGRHDGYNETYLTSNKGEAQMGAFFAANGIDGRDYNVLTPSVTDKVRKNELFWCRIYCVIGKLSAVREKAGALAEKVYYGYLRPDTAAETGVMLGTDDGKEILLPADGTGEPLFKVYTSHVMGSRPLYLLYDTEADRYLVSVDPYILSTTFPLSDFKDVTVSPWKNINRKKNGNTIYCVNDGKTEYMGILGYVMTTEDGEGTPLGEILNNDLFPGNGYRDELIRVRR